jgi:dTDP-4-dehydrorhamnose reductase
MKLMVTGCKGQLARSLIERASNRPDMELVALGRPELDLEQPGSAAEAIAEICPDVVINAAAYTAVDRAEDEPELAMRINADGAGEVAEAAARVGAHVIQISTDYVFDGRAAGDYAEDAPTSPVGAYGRTKLAGEEQVRAANWRHAIIRTAWVYSPFGHNFVKTMLRLAADRDELRIVSDQKGCPTSALDIADALLTALPRVQDWGATYHLAAPKPCSWADLASVVFEASRATGGPSADVIPISTAQYPTPAKRPMYSVLDSGRFARDFGIRLPDWRSSVAEVVERLVAG